MSKNNPEKSKNIKIWQERVSNQKLAKTVRDQLGIDIDTSSFSPEQRDSVNQMLEERIKLIKNVPETSSVGLNEMRKILREPTIENLKVATEIFKNYREKIVLGITGQITDEQKEANIGHLARLEENLKSFDNPEYQKGDIEFDKRVAHADDLAKKQSAAIPGRKTEEELQKELAELEAKRKADFQRLRERNEVEDTIHKWAEEKFLFSLDDKQGTAPND